jgi:protein-L-isoaspartate(D-aspartate) O-methyltransferase
MFDFAQARQNMIQSQLQPNGVLDPRVLQAFNDVPRELFVPPPARSFCYADQHIDLDGGRVLLAPMVLGRMIEEAQIDDRDRVLMVGGATGYGAAVVAMLATAGHVTDQEDDPRFEPIFQQAMTAMGTQNITRISGKGPAGGDGSGVGYDVVIIQAAVADVPNKWGAMLKPDGRMLIPINRDGGPVGDVHLFIKTAGGHVSSRALFDASVPYLPGYEPVQKFTLA